MAKIQGNTVFNFVYPEHSFKVSMTGCLDVHPRVHSLGTVIFAAQLTRVTDNPPTYERTREAILTALLDIGSRRIAPKSMPVLQLMVS